MSYFIGELLPIKNLLIIGQSIKFENVIYVNDTIRLDTSISRYSSSVKFVQFNFRFTRNDTQVASGEIQIKIL